MSRFKRTHITVKEEQIGKFIEYINSLESMLDFIKTTDDICLSDIREIGRLIGYMTTTFNLEVDQHSGSHTTQWKRKETVKDIINE